MKYISQLVVILLSATTATAALRGAAARKLTSYANCNDVECCDSRAANSCGGGTPFFDDGCFNRLRRSRPYEQCVADNTHFSTEGRVTITNHGTNRRLYAPAQYSAGSSDGNLAVAQNAEWTFIQTSGCPDAAFRECFQVKNRATGETLGSNEFFQIFTYPDDLLSLALNRLRFRFLEATCPSNVSNALWCGHIVDFDRKALTDSPNRAGQVETRPVDRSNNSQLWIIRGR